MPNVCIERVEMSRHQYQNLKTYIMSERRRKQKEQELGEEQEKKRRQREEERKKKEQEQRISLESITKELKESRSKLQEFKNDKTNLFSHLKKVISDEDENKKKNAQERSERNEQLLNHSILASQVTGYPTVPIPTMLNKSSLSKRPHSPDQTSPVCGKAYKTFPQDTPFAPKLATTAATSTTGSFVPGYASMHGYQYPSMSPFSSQRLLATTNSLQQQLEHANNKAGFSADDKYKLQQQLQRGAPVPPPQQANTGSIVNGYPVRTQTNPTSAFTPTLTGQRGTAPMPSALSHSQYTRY